VSSMPANANTVSVGRSAAKHDAGASRRERPSPTTKTVGASHWYQPFNSIVERFQVTGGGSTPSGELWLGSKF
jgi:hypothetical protein